MKCVLVSMRSDVHDIKNTLPTQLLQLREHLMVRFRAVFATVNITDAQWRAIRVINELGTVDFSTLSELSLVAKPSLSRVLSSLEGRGFVQRAVVAADQRQIELSMTAAGRSFLAGLKPHIDAVYQGLAADLGEARMAEVSSLVADTIAVLDRVDHTELAPAG